MAALSHQSSPSKGLSPRAEGKGRFTCQPREEKQKINSEFHVPAACPESGTGQKIPTMPQPRGMEPAVAVAYTIHMSGGSGPLPSACAPHLVPVVLVGVWGSLDPLLGLIAQAW